MEKFTWNIYEHDIDRVTIKIITRTHKCVYVCVIYIEIGVMTYHGGIMTESENEKASNLEEEMRENLVCLAE